MSQPSPAKRARKKRVQLLLATYEVDQAVIALNARTEPAQVSRAIAGTREGTVAERVWITMYALLKGAGWTGTFRELVELEGEQPIMQGEPHE